MLTTVIVALVLSVTGNTFGAIDPQIASVFNNLLNVGMLIYLARLDRRVTPRVEHIEEAVTASIDTRRAGGQREHDPA